MPLPRRLAELNKSFTNRITRHIAGWAPGFAIVDHVGRRTGRPYATPVNVFVDGRRYRFALTYGQGEWVRNVLAAGGCTIRTRRRTVELAAPQLTVDADRRGVPVPARWILAAVHVDEFLDATAAGGAPTT